MSYGQTDSYPPAGYDEAHASAPVRRSAPPSVHVVAVLGYLAGLALVTAGVGAWVVSLGGGRSLDVSRFSQVVVDLRDMGLAAGAVIGFVGLLVMVLARKLQRGRQWVRVLVVALSAFAITVTLYDGLLGQGNANALFGLVFPVIFVVLLSLPPARSWFRRRDYRSSPSSGPAR
ncbi:MAG TPA: hypothetical protein VGP31_05235 [Planosporangium sp.]|jgi:hypothetical protein|nr:hypothetical protein [Planosporangium sp.]